MASRWGKAGKVGLIVFTILMSLVAFAYAMLFRLTDLNDTLAKEAEINQKGKEYGMYFAQQDAEQALSVPENENSGPTIQKACAEFQKGEREYSRTTKTGLPQIFNMQRYVKNGPFKIRFTSEDEKAMVAFRPYLAEFLTTCDLVLDRPRCVFKRDWSKPFMMSMPEYRQLNQVRRLNLLEGYLAAKRGDSASFRRIIATDIRLRKCLSHMDEWLWPYLATVTAKKESAAFFTVGLSLLKSPTKEVLTALRENLKVKINGDFRHLCRTYFYMGAGGFPSEADWKSILPEHLRTAETKFVSKIPRVKKAWQLRIQWAAIKGFEAGLANDEKPDAIERAYEVYDREAFTSGMSSWFVSWVLPGGYVGTPLPGYDNAPGKLDAKLKSLGY